MTRHTVAYQFFVTIEGELGTVDEDYPFTEADVQHEILNRSDRTEVQEVFRRLASERAGLASRPSDLGGQSPLERFLRFFTSLGDQYERELAQIVGAEAAHAMRAKDNGWGYHYGMGYGCPGDSRE